MDIQSTNHMYIIYIYIFCFPSILDAGLWFGSPEKNPRRPPQAYLILAGCEPLTFTNIFPYWERDPSITAQVRHCFDTSLWPLDSVISSHPSLQWRLKVFLLLLWQEAV